jgi:Asp-tRNA(Asn)/Glu-tRNA(Gln) amidotransferase A subunit family amidase
VTLEVDRRATTPATARRWRRRCPAWSPRSIAGWRESASGSCTELVDGTAPDVAARVRQAAEALAAAGALVEEVSVPQLRYGLSAYYLIAPAEASSNLARYDGVRYGLRVDAPDVVAMNVATRTAGFGAEVKRRIMLGTYALSAGYYDAYYGQAQRVRTLVSRRPSPTRTRAFDVLLGATAPPPPSRSANQDRRPHVDVPVRHLHRPVQPGRVTRPSASRSAPARTACRSGSRCSRPPWARRCCSHWPAVLERAAPDR